MMIKSINKKVNQINKKVGLNYEVPLPSRKTLAINETINIITSVTCLSIGVVVSSKIFIGLGVLSGLSAGLTHLEKKKID